MKNDFLQDFTNRLIEDLQSCEDSESYTLPWSRIDSIPQNPITGVKYRGINALILNQCQLTNKYEYGLYATFKQWTEKGFTIIKGSKSVPIVFYQYKETSDPDTDEKSGYTIIKKYNVFNVDQVSGDNKPVPVSNIVSHDSIDKGISNYSIEINHTGSQACYNPDSDIIRMPSKGYFKNSEHYYSTLLHELIHSTGHKSRLGRGLQVIDREKYAFEELIAEIGAAILCNTLGVSKITQRNHFIYIKSWIKALQDDKRAIQRAAGQAQKAVDYLMENMKIKLD